ncbi:unnamed protein product [Leptidea sinapis]|uniref:DUF4794 domain-containing protein n=1 Tax=Leptidea sinapis TaxID=189913 RepID=A0A5E4QJX6_9NEOP|nr:unnamed protein product [Leptidea sinapis]
MASYTTLILLGFFSCGTARKTSRPSAAAPDRQLEVQYREGDERGHTHGYESIEYAAIPLHGPVPVLHVLSPPGYHPTMTTMRMTRPRRRPSAHTTQAAPADLSGYASNQHEIYEPLPYASYSYEPFASMGAFRARMPPSPPRAASPAALAAADDYDDEAQASSVVMYARPDPRGGYTYRRAPLASVATTGGGHQSRPRPKRDPEPIILRIHRHKIIQD